MNNLALFVSVARDEANPKSDIDILVEFDRLTGLFGWIELKLHLEDLLGRKVDSGTPDSLKEQIRDYIL